MWNSLMHFRFQQFILRIFASRTRVLFDCVHRGKFVLQRYCATFDLTHTAALLRSMGSSGVSPMDEVFNGVRWCHEVSLLGAA